MNTSVCFGHHTFNKPSSLKNVTLMLHSCPFSSRIQSVSLSGCFLLPDVVIDMLLGIACDGRCLQLKISIKPDHTTLLVIMDTSICMCYM